MLDEAADSAGDTKRGSGASAGDTERNPGDAAVRRDSPGSTRGQAYSNLAYSNIHEKIFQPNS